MQTEEANGELKAQVASLKGFLKSVVDQRDEALTRVWMLET
jgi:hypothetical protein